MIKDKRILITGGCGSIGSELVRQLALDNKVFILDLSERAFTLREELKQKGYWVHSRVGDIRDKDTIFDVFSDFKPQIVFHAAALKHVTPNEEYPREAFKTNLDGTMNLVEEAKKWGCLEKFVFISTDKVVNAKCIMGISKLAAESFVRLQDDRFVAVRFGNVMASSGSVMEIWENQLKHGEPLTVTHPNMERYFMSIPQACELVIQAAQSKEARLMILNMGEPMNIIDVARRFLRERGKEDYPIKIIGIRPGESMQERLMTKEEEEIAVQRGNFFIL